MPNVLEITAMWNLNGDDIKKAKAELETRRATLKAKYDEEIKRIDTELADIETVERVAVTFVSGRKGDDAPSATHAEPQKDASSSDTEKPAESSSEMEDKPATEQKGSRWRMRLGTTMSETEAA